LAYRILCAKRQIIVAARFFANAGAAA